MSLRNVKQGMTGPEVRAIQEALNEYYRQCIIAEDGIFGPETDKLVHRFQKEKHLVSDGIVGPKTRASLFPLAVVTVRAFGMRLRPPSLLVRDPNGDPPSLAPLTLPSLTLPTVGYTPLKFPGLGLPLTSPVLGPPPALLGFPIPIHHFEIQPGSTISLGKPVDVAFSLTLSGVVMIGPEDGRHQEFSTGLIMSTPGLFQGGDWTVGWFAQFTHVEQLSRVGNFSWQPNAQVVAGHGALPFYSVTASPANVQFDVNDSISVSIGGPSVSATLSPGGGTLGWGLASFGIIGKF
jgi:hypothetical protein